MAVAVPAVLGALGVGAVAYKAKKGRPAPSPDKLATMSMRRSLNDYWRNRMPITMVDQSTNRSDYNNTYQYVSALRQLLILTNPVTTRGGS